MTTTYIDIDSTFRNRKEYPNPANFKIEYNTRKDRLNINIAQNPLSDSYPYYQWQWGCTGVGSDDVSSIPTFLVFVGLNCLEERLVGADKKGLVKLLEDVDKQYLTQSS